ncbi:bifunctional (p)ppGpp synthetase/guanosine-3',5'-bis(diphosphate) 3'-pyrophosphohydrolase, partial [bacterium]|nr:bifunctional (p)ppGpp synthetase/guanosine-3',5'-bis(diphosphate) 3'-pyrophosphohydrolase [bacterium]
NAFKDYVSNPKLNLYQSIHTTIVKNQSLMEVQIRTIQMDKTAEYGIAAH